MDISKVLIIIAMAYFPAFAVTNQFRGVNWADKRDNFVSEVLVLSGLSLSDTYESASIVADRVIGQFVELLGTNSVRLPINEPTVSTFWNTYTGVIDVGLKKGRVVLGYWGPAQPSGPKNMDNWWAMWDTVVKKYGEDPNAYFEIFNEPHMYTKEELRNLYASWLTRYPNVPRDHIILDGSGMAQNVPDIASDSRFDGCLFAVHEYTFWNMSITTEAGWKNSIKGKVGNYSDRTICTEWGGAMSPGDKAGVHYETMDYNQQPTNYFMAYIRGIPEQLREWKMGSFYWPGLRDGDWYSMTKRSGEGANIKLEIVNQSGVDRMQYSWTDTVEVPPVPQEPFGSFNGELEIAGEPTSIPGTIEVENFDLGGNQVSFYDKDTENKGNAYRKNAVDVVGLDCAEIAEGVFVKGTDCAHYALGYTEAGEWLEYTVNVESENVYTIEARVASGGDNSSFRLFLDDEPIADTIKAENTGDWDTYKTISAKTIKLSKGEHILKLLITGSYVNIDNLKFTEGTIRLSEPLHFISKKGMQEYSVYHLNGALLGNYNAVDMNSLKREMHRSNLKTGIYLVRSKTAQINQLIEIKKQDVRI
jgi:hypothetical protein